MIKKILKASWLIIAVVFMYLPIIVLAVYSFTDTAIIGASGRFSLNNYKVLFMTPELLKMIKDTLILAAGSAAIAMLLGTFGAIGAFYSKKTPRTVVTTFNQIPVVNADVVTGFSICVFLIVVLGISKESYVPLVAGHVVLSTPFVYLSVVPKLKQMDSSLYAVSAASGQAMNEAVTAGLTKSKVNQGYLEGSNVQVVDEMVNMIVAQRAYEMNSKAIQATDEMMSQANNLRR